MRFIRTAAGTLALCAIAACATTVPSSRDTPAISAVAPTPPASPAPDPVAELVPIAAPAPPALPAPVAVAAPAPPVAPKPPAMKPEPPRAAPVAAKPAKPPATTPQPAAKATQVAVSGKLELVASGRNGVVAGELAEGLVYFLPRAGVARPKPGTFTVDTRSKGFTPSVLVVPVGSTVRFPNRDSILHNVFSRTPGSLFDLGFYGPGQVKQQVLAKPGLVIVNCNVHHTMRADIVVLATPHYTRPDRNGRYTLSGLPAGAGTLVFWHPRAQAQSVQVSLPTQGVVTRRLAATKPSRHAGMAGH